MVFFGGIGFSKYNIGNSDITEVDNKLTGLGFATSVTTVDAKNFSYKYGIGINILESFSIEAFYANLGQVSINSSTTSPAESLSANVDIKGLGFDLVKYIGPVGLSGGIIKIDNDITITSSLGSANVPIDDYFLPKVGGNIKINNYRIEVNRTFLTVDSYLNNFTLSYIFDVF